MLDYTQFNKRLGAAARRSGRDGGSVRVVAVTKGVSLEAVREAVNSELKEFGESRYQEAVLKIPLLGPGLGWHFLGRIQSNKLFRILDHFSWIQSIDREEILEKAQSYLKSKGEMRDALFEINISGEAAKGGMSYSEAERLLKSRRPEEFSALRIRGLMGIGPRTGEEARIRKAFGELNAFYERMKSVWPGMDTLSMGMSRDFEIAVEEGSNMVRIGTLLFGERS